MANNSEISTYLFVTFRIGGKESYQLPEDGRWQNDYQEKL